MILNADKNRGNVLLFDEFWDKFNIEYLTNNNDNFDVISNNITENNIKDIINKSNKIIINIIMKYKDIIMDYKKAINRTFAGINNNVGIWAQIPKVHKKDKMEIL